MNLLYGLRRSARLFGDQPAILNTGATYAEFYQRVQGAGQLLARLGVRRGDRVAVLMLNSSRFLELYYATALTGAVIVPLNIRWSAQEIAFVLNDSGARLLVVDDRFAPLREQLAGAADGVAVYLFAGHQPCPAGMAGYEEGVHAASGAADWPEPGEEDLVGLFYTSGTTGGPKGVMLTHRNLVANAFHASLSLEISPDSVWLHSAPMFHLANGGAMYAMVMRGARHCFLPAFEPEEFLRAVERYRVTAALLVPTMLNMVMNHPAIDRYDVSSLKSITYGASPMPLDLLRRAMDRFGRCFRQGYGLTETSPLLTVLEPEDHCFDNAQERFAPIKSAGRPVPGVEIRVVNDHDHDLPPGQVGEIVARGANIMKGYWNRPEITAEVVRGGWFHTGDMGMLDERGYLYILDRKKDMIKTGGENVYSPEVEDVIYAHPDVLEAAVIGVPDPQWGEAIKAVVARRPGRHLTERQLIEYCRERLTHFKCPTSVDFAETLPKGGTGKIQKAALREGYWKGLAKGVN